MAILTPRVNSITELTGNTMPIDDTSMRLLIESNINIANSLKGIQDNLKQLNDQNVLHTATVTNEHTNQSNNIRNIIDTLKIMTDKYWWLILVLIGALLTVTGYSNIAKMFSGG